MHSQVNMRIEEQLINIGCKLPVFAF